MSDRKRRYSSADWLALQEIAKDYPPKMGGNCRSVWLAMETLAWEQRKTHHGRAFVTSQGNLARIACIGVTTLKTVCAFLEEIGLVTITRRKTSACRRDFNHIALRYPKTKADERLWNHSRVDDEVTELVLHSKGGAESPTATAFPLALQGNSAPLYEDKPEAVTRLATKLKRLAGVNRNTTNDFKAENPGQLRALRDSLDREGRRCMFKALVLLDGEHEPQAVAIYAALIKEGEESEIYGEALLLTFILRHSNKFDQEEWNRVTSEHRKEILEWLDSLDGVLRERWDAIRASFCSLIHLPADD